MEIWKSIKGYEGLYEVSNMGQVRSLARYTTKGKILKQYVNKTNGYCYVSLSKNNKRSSKRVHCLVMRAFNPLMNKKNLEIDHKDRNRLNNKLNNLEWVTHIENIHRRSNVNYYSIPVIDLDTKEIFKSETLASQSVGGNKGNAVHRVCVGKRKHYKGHKFAFYKGELL